MATEGPIPKPAEAPVDYARPIKVICIGAAMSGKQFFLFYTALCFSGAVSGLIAGAVMSGLDGAKGIPGWRWLFIVEGAVTIVVAIVAMFILLDYPDTVSTRLTPEEQTLAIVRLMHDKKSFVTQRGRLTPLQGLKAAIVDLRVYFFIVLFMAQNGATTISYFIPTILQQMGYAGTKAQWMTIPIWAVGTLALLILPQTADRTKNRQWHIVGGLSVALVSSIVCVTVTWNNAARYAMLCFYVSGIYTVLPLILTWASEVMALPSEKRAVVIGMVNCFGSISSIFGSYLWPSTTSPDYHLGFATVSAFMGLGVVLAATMPTIFEYLPKFATKAERELAVIDRQEE